MTKPAKPGSLRKYVEDSIHAIPGCENVDDLMRRQSDGKIADYLLYNRKVIVEQKEYRHSPEHVENGRRYQEYLGGLFRKYGIDPNTLDTSNCEEEFGLLSAEEVGRLRKLKDNFYDKIKDEIRNANNQIQSIKKTLEIPDAVGVVLVIFDCVDGVMPDVISQRVNRTFNTVRDGEPLYKHVESFVFSLRMKDLLYNKYSQLNGHIPRKGFVTSLEVGRRILDDLRKGIGGGWTRKAASTNDIVEQLVPNVFTH